MKTRALIGLFLVFSLIFAPLCSADAEDVILAPMKVVEGLLWVPAIALVVAVGVVGLPMYYYQIKTDQSLQQKETKNAS